MKRRMRIRGKFQEKHEELNNVQFSPLGLNQQEFRCIPDRTGARARPRSN